MYEVTTYEIKKYLEYPINFRIMIKDTFFVPDCTATQEEIKNRYKWLTRTSFRTDFVERLRVF